MDSYGALLSVISWFTYFFIKLQQFKPFRNLYILFVATHIDTIGRVMRGHPWLKEIPNTKRFWREAQWQVTFLGRAPKKQVSENMLSASRNAKVLFWKLSGSAMGVLELKGNTEKFEIADGTYWITTSEISSFVAGFWFASFHVFVITLLWKSLWYTFKAYLREILKTNTSQYQP